MFNSCFLLLLLLCNQGICPFDPLQITTFYLYVRSALTEYTGYYWISGRITGQSDITVKKKVFITIQSGSVRMSVLLSKRPYLYPSKRPYYVRLNVRQSVICSNIINLFQQYQENMFFFCLFKGIFVVKCKGLNYRISVRPNPNVQTAYRRTINSSPGAHTSPASLVKISFQVI